MGACAPPDPPPEAVRLELDGDTIELSPGARVHDVRIAADDSAEFRPPVTAATAGDVIRFAAQDGGPHALVFDEIASGQAATSFLRATGQLRGLPLLSSGSVWVVSLREAPAGLYLARCLTHGGEATITVAAATGRVP